MSISVTEQNELRVNGEVVPLESDIYEYVSFDDRLVVLLNSDHYEDLDKRVGQNILCFDLKGNVLWRVESHEMEIENHDGILVPEAYFGLWYDKKQRQLRCGTIQYNFDLDPNTGQISNSEWTR